MDLHKIDWESMPWEPVREGITRKAFSGNGATLALHKLMPKHEPKPHKIAERIGKRQDFRGHATPGFSDGLARSPPFAPCP